MRPGVVADFLALRFPDPPLTLSPEGHRGLVARMDAAGIAGGAVYDALIAAVALAEDLTLATLDRRATETYERLDAPYRQLAA